jgi:hypothetical protein
VPLGISEKDDVKRSLGQRCRCLSCIDVRSQKVSKAQVQGSRRETPQLACKTSRLLVTQLDHADFKNYAFDVSIFNCLCSQRFSASGRIPIFSLAGWSFILQNHVLIHRAS